MNAYKQNGQVVIRISGPEVAAFWEDMRIGLWETLQNSHSEIDESWVLQELMSGRQEAWAAITEDEMKAFTITQPIMTSKGAWLDMPFSYSDGDPKVSNAVFKLVRKLAKKEGFIGVKFITSQPRVFKWAKKHGMTERYREFVLPFEKEE